MLLKEAPRAEFSLGWKIRGPGRCRDSCWLLIYTLVIVIKGIFMC